MSFRNLPSFPPFVLLVGCASTGSVDGGAFDAGDAGPEAARSYADAVACPTMPKRLGGAPCTPLGAMCLLSCVTCENFGDASYTRAFSTGDPYVCSNGVWTLDSQTSDLCFGGRGEYVDPECKIRYDAGAE